MLHRGSSTTHQKIYDTVRKIPRGRVATYGEVAEFAGIPRQARLVGYALHNLQPGTDVPWHRVINAKGMISLSNLDGGHDEQKRLLRKEGVVFIKDIIDFSRFSWLSTRRRTKKAR